MCLTTNANIAANIDGIFVFLQEVVAADEDFSQPFQDFRIVENLVLDQLLGY